MNKKLKSILLTLVAVVALGVIAYASVTVSKNGQQQGAAEIINFDNRQGINWTYDGFGLNVHGINWADFHALATTYGDHSGINWQAIPGS